MKHSYARFRLIKRDNKLPSAIIFRISGIIPSFRFRQLALILDTSNQIAVLLFRKKKAPIGGLVKKVFTSLGSLYNTNSLSRFTKSFKFYNACSKRK